MNGFDSLSFGGILLKRLQLIRESSVRLEECVTDRAGREGEEIVGALIRDMLKENRNTNTKVYESLRFPRPKELGKFEVDILIVSPMKVLIIEVKNLGGFIKKNQGSTDWFQKNRQGNIMIHEDPLTLLEEKRQAFKENLDVNHCPYPLERIETVLVNVNPHVIWGKDLARDMRVMDCEGLKHKIRGFCQNSDGFVKRDERKALSSIVSVLDSLPTWDEIHLNGGAVIRGDIVKMAPGFNFRPTMSMFHIFMPRSRVWGWVLPPIAALKKRDGFGFRFVKIKDPMGQFFIRPAGNSRLQPIKVCHVTSVYYGYQYSADRLKTQK